MTKFALVPFITMACLEIATEDCLWVNAKRHFLWRLHGFEQGSFFLFLLLFISLLFLSQCLLPLLVERRFGFASDGLLSLDLGNMFLNFGRSVFLIVVEPVIA